MEFERRKKDNVTTKQMKKEYPLGNKRKLKKYYTRQNELIDEFLGAGDEERLAVVEAAKMGPRIRFAVNASFAVNFCLFCIQLYAAVSTGSLSLFATAADAFVSPIPVSGAPTACQRQRLTNKTLLDGSRLIIRHVHNVEDGGSS